MKQFFSICLTAILFFNCGTANKAVVNTQTNALSDQEKNEGWVMLFDGTTTNGWHTYGKSTGATSWKVSDGALFLDTTKTNGRRETGDLITNDEFENYHLSLDWKVAQGANSGIIFNVQDDPAKFRNTYETGPEMQVLDNERHPDAKIHKHRAGDLYDLIPSAKETVKPAGEWNHAEIKLNNGKLDLYLNGTNVVSTTMFDDNWKTMVANSKFKTMPAFGTIRKGRIALQDHGDNVWFKNIKIRRL